MTTPLTIAELEDALDRWGGDLSSWPPQQAERARQLAAADATAAARLEAARVLDGYLDELTRHAPPPWLASRITARAAQVPRDAVERLLGWLGGRLWRAALLALVPVVAGLLLGTATVEPVDSGLASDVMTLAFSDLYGEIDDAQQ